MGSSFEVNLQFWREYRRREIKVEQQHIG